MEPSLQVLTEASSAGLEPALFDVLHRTRELVWTYGWNAMAYQILNPGFSLWFSETGDAVVGYVTAHGYRVVAGAPVCHPDRMADATSAFERDATQRGQRVCYFGAQERLGRILQARGPVTRLLLGAQPVWHPMHWPERINGKASLRAQLARARHKQVEVAGWKPQAAVDHPDLKRCLQEWLERRGLPPMHFLVEPETLTRLYDRKIYVATRGKACVGFLIASPIPMRNGWLIEQIIRGCFAPNGTSELLLDFAVRDLGAGGATYVTLGMAPLSRRAGESQPAQPFWMEGLLAWMRAHGRRFYNFQGLEAFKSKFLPEFWEPLYAMASSRRMPVRGLYAIAGAFSGMSPPRFIARAVTRALAQEFHWGRQKVRRALDEVKPAR